MSSSAFSKVVVLALVLALACCIILQHFEIFQWPPLWTSYAFFAGLLATQILIHVAWKTEKVPQKVMALSGLKLLASLIFLAVLYAVFKEGSAFKPYGLAFICLYPIFALADAFILLRMVKTNSVSSRDR